MHVRLVAMYVCRRIFSLANANYIDSIMIVTTVTEFLTRNYHTHTYTRTRNARKSLALGHRAGHVGPKLVFALLNVLPRCYPAQYIQFHQTKRLDPLTRTST